MLYTQWRVGGERRNTEPAKAEQGSSMLEFSLVMAFMVPLFAATFSIGMTLSKGIQASNVCRDAVVLMVRSNTDPNSGLDLSLTQNQRIIVRAASGLHMNSDAQNDPDPNGMGVVILSKVVMVGPGECATGIVPAPGNAPPWNSGNCPNYGQYAFAYRVVIGNGSRWTSTLGNVPNGIVRGDGTVSPADIASNTNNRAQHMGANGVVTLTPGKFALVSEMYVDIGYLNLFSIWNTPVIFARSIS
jgi:hypothetical protein